MRLINTKRTEDIRFRVKARFAEFNQSSSASKGRKYPKELQALARQAAAEGVSIPTLRQLTGVSSTALARWSKQAKAEGAHPRPEVKVAPARRLEVIGGDADKRRQPVVIRLPSGVSIELGDSSALSADFLAALAGLGGDHAASR